MALTEFPVELNFTSGFTVEEQCIPADGSSMEGSIQRPFKVWSGDRSVKRSLTASTLGDLIQKGCRKLDLNEKQVRVVLETDGTEVDEEDYFSFLPSDTTLLFLTSSDKWTQGNQVAEQMSRDEPDSGGGSARIRRSRHDVASVLKADISHIITLSDEELQVLADADATDLAKELGESSAYVESLQDACQRHLDDRHQTKEAIDLLRLYSKAHSISPYVDTETSKKRRHSRDVSSSS